ncbi:hypothetical protein ANTHELSMS3_01841 [Antarctobacter heliothermus]|uniref:Alpha/beta hydrolase n=2 Tax=Antarctobacter heliothermus TaxID=74033 RepID=A0A222E3G3_9RHOB|nr:hypothetical protein ANTHELSMS3_01841 [Antarctobacter heliothermus]
MLRNWTSRFFTRSALLCLGALSLASAGHAQTWDQKIAAARDNAARLEQMAEEKGAPMLGTLDLRADVAEFKCLILAEMLNAGDVSPHIQLYGPNPADEPDLNDPYAIRLHATADAKWAYQASLIVDLSEDQRLEMWNLTCDGKLGIPTGLVAADWATRATFRVEYGILYVLGDIEEGFFDEFQSFIQTHEVNRVFFGSRGGSVGEAVKTGRLIRQLGLETDLYATCASACPLAYLGGTPRLIDNWRFKLGFHQMAYNGEPLPLDHEFYGLVGDYVTEMGANGDYVVTAMKSAPIDQMYYPEFQDMCDAEITWVRGNCSQPHPSVRR